MAFALLLSKERFMDPTDSFNVSISLSNMASSCLLVFTSSFNMSFRRLIVSKLNSLSKRSFFSSLDKLMKFLKSLIDIDINDLNVSKSIPIYFSISLSMFTLPARSFNTPFSHSSNIAGFCPLFTCTSVPFETNSTSFNSSPFILFGSVVSVTVFFFLPFTFLYKA